MQVIYEVVDNAGTSGEYTMPLVEVLSTTFVRKDSSYEDYPFSREEAPVNISVISGHGVPTKLEFSTTSQDGWNINGAENRVKSTRERISKLLLNERLLLK